MLTYKLWSTYIEDKYSTISNYFTDYQKKYYYSENELAFLLLLTVLCTLEAIIIDLVLSPLEVALLLFRKKIKRDRKKRIAVK